MIVDYKHKEQGKVHKTRKVKRMKIYLNTAVRQARAEYDLDVLMNIIDNEFDINPTMRISQFATILKDYAVMSYGDAYQMLSGYNRKYRKSSTYKEAMRNAYDWAKWELKRAG